MGSCWNRDFTESYEILTKIGICNPLNEYMLVYEYRLLMLFFDRLLRTVMLRQIQTPGQKQQGQL